MRRILILLVIVFTIFFILIDKSMWRYTGKKVVILGIDGFDPFLIEKFLKENKLPNIKKIIEQNGCFKRLQTILPPQSPVVWSSFITGKNPGNHSIFDFIQIDKTTYQPYLSTSKKTDKNKIENLLKGKTFFEVFEEHKIQCTAFKSPCNFPPRKTKQKTISCLGTPDLLGGYGTVYIYTNNIELLNKFQKEDGIEVIRIELKSKRQEARSKKQDIWLSVNRTSNIEDQTPNLRSKCLLIGPENMKIEFEIVADKANKLSLLKIQDNRIILREKEWSDWVRVKFYAISYFKPIYAITKFYLKNISQYFELVVYPLQIDPLYPAMPISTPKNYSKELYHRFGGYPTQGMPEIPNLLEKGVLNDTEWLLNALEISNQKWEMLFYELEKFYDGILFFYLSSSDLISHLFYTNTDVMETFYKEIDLKIKRLLDVIDEKTLLIIISDHGFKPVYREFNLNAFLKEKGYLKVINEYDKESEFLMNVDIQSSKAYGIGFNALYLHNASEQDIKNIIQDLENVVDKKTRIKVIKRVYQANKVYKGRYINIGPDLIIGYNSGYKVTTATAKGMVTDDILIDNTSKWCADHCIDPQEVPGVFICNTTIENQNPHIMDIIPSVIRWFGIETNEDFDGEDLCLKRR
ncbi:MAG: alkaline phosphatase family protein [Candidatus Hydrogenedentota bacterium]